MNHNAEKKQTSAGDRLLLILSILFLLVTVSLTVLLASGVLKHGLAGPFTFVIYVVAGLLVSFACFGILSSTGDVIGQRFGARWRLGGAIVGFVVVAVGGGLYETFVRPAQNLDLQFVLIEPGTGEFARVEGTMRMVVGAETRSVSLEGTGVAPYRNLPPNWRNRTARVFLSSSSWRLTDTQKTELTIGGQDTIYLDVERKPVFATYDESELILNVDHGLSDQMASGGRTFTICAMAVSESEQSIPIRGQGHIVLTHSGLELRRLPAEVGNGTMSDFISIAPRQPVRLCADGMLPSDWQFLLDRRADSYLEVYYYDLNNVNTDPFESSFFVLDRSFLGIPDT